MTLASSIPASGSLLRRGDTITLVWDGDGVNFPVITYGPPSAPAEVVLALVDTYSYQTGYSGSIETSGNQVTYTFQRDAGWDADSFVINIGIVGSHFQVTYTLLAEGEYPPDMQPFTDPVEGATQLAIYDSTNFIGFATGLDFNSNLDVAEIGNGIIQIDVIGGGGDGSTVGVQDRPSPTGSPTLTGTASVISFGADLSVTRPDPTNDPGRYHVEITGELGAQNFTELDDTPSTFTGQGSRLVAVASTENGLEFIDQPPGTFVGLTDTSSQSLAANAGKILRVNQLGTEIDYIDEIVAAGGQEVVGGITSAAGSPPTATIVTNSVGIGSVSYEVLDTVIRLTFSTPFADASYFCQVSSASTGLGVGSVEPSILAKTATYVDIIASSSANNVDFSATSFAFDIIAQDGPSLGGEGGGAPDQTLDEVINVASPDNAVVIPQANPLSFSATADFSPLSLSRSVDGVTPLASHSVNRETEAGLVVQTPTATQRALEIRPDGIQFRGVDATYSIAPDNNGTGNGAALTIEGGSGSTAGGDVTIQGGNATAGDDGSVIIGLTDTRETILGQGFTILESATPALSGSNPGRGQFWVNSSPPGGGPNRPYFTDETGVSFDLSEVVAPTGNGTVNLVTDLGGASSINPEGIEFTGDRVSEGTTPTTARVRITDLQLLQGAVTTEPVFQLQVPAGGATVGTANAAGEFPVALNMLIPDGSVLMDNGYVPSVPRAIVTKAWADTELAAKADDFNTIYNGLNSRVTDGQLASWRFGTGAPTIPSGIENQFWVDTTNLEIWRDDGPLNDGWQKIASGGGDGGGLGMVRDTFINFITGQAPSGPYDPANNADTFFLATDTNQQLLYYCDGITWDEVQAAASTIKIEPGVVARTAPGKGSASRLDFDALAAELPLATSTAKGLLPQLSNTATEYLDGTGAYSVPAGPPNRIDNLVALSGTLAELSAAINLDPFGTNIPGSVPVYQDDGGGGSRLPATDGSLLTNLPEQIDKTKTQAAIDALTPASEPVNRVYINTDAPRILQINDGTDIVPVGNPIDDASLELGGSGSAQIKGFAAATDGFIPKKSGGNITWVAEQTGGGAITYYDDQDIGAGVTLPVAYVNTCAITQTLEIGTYLVFASGYVLAFGADRLVEVQIARNGIAFPTSLRKFSVANGDHQCFSTQTVITVASGQQALDVTLQGRSGAASGAFMEEAGLTMIKVA